MAYNAASVFLEKVFYRYSIFMAAHYLWFLIIPVVLSGISIPGLFRAQLQLDIESLLLPVDALSRQEMRIVRDMEKKMLQYGLDKFEEKYYERFGKSESYQKRIPSNKKATIFVKADSETGNILDRQTLKILTETDTKIRKNFQFSYKGKNISLQSDLCPHCVQDLNNWLHGIYRWVKEPELQKNPNFRLRYPTWSVFGKVYALNQALFAVKLAENGDLEQATVASLNYRYKDDSPEILRNSIPYFKFALEKFWREQISKTNLKAVVDLEEKSILEAIDELRIVGTPLIAVTALFLVFFILLANASFSKKSDCLSLEALVGVVAVLFSLITSFSLVIQFGVPLNPLVTACPFLTLCIGVDDSFLILSAWNNLKPRQISHEQRLATVMGDVGVAITVTTLTDVICFIIGYFLCASEALANYCLFAISSLSMDFVYQITVFPAFILIVQKLKSACRRPKIEEISTFSGLEKIPIKNSPSKSKKLMSKVLFSKSCRIAIISGYLLYLAIALIGCINIKVDLSLRKLILDNSPVLSYFNLLEQELCTDVEVNIAVQRAPNLENSTEIDRFLEFVQALESTPYSAGPQATNLWLRDYLEYKQYSISPKTAPTSQNDQLYLSLRNSKKEPSLIFAENFTRIKGFFFETSYYGTNTWEKRFQLVQIWRQICQRFPEFESSIYHFISLYTDQRIAIASGIPQTMGAAILAMIVVSAIFLSSSTSIFLVSFSVVSIQVGVVGFLFWWNIDLDILSMISILMVVGFAVDYTMHVCYRFETSSQENRKEKVLEIIYSTAWPILLAGLSTACGILTLAFLTAYFAKAFYRAVVLVVIFGLFHSFLLLPILLYCLDGFVSFKRKCIKR